MMIDTKSPKANLDGSRPHTCQTHGAGTTATPVPIPGRPGWFQNYATGCKACDGKPTGLPYQPGPGLAN